MRGCVQASRCAVSGRFGVEGRRLSIKKYWLKFIDNGLSQRSFPGLAHFSAILAPLSMRLPKSRATPFPGPEKASTNKRPGKRIHATPTNPSVIAASLRRAGGGFGMGSASLPSLPLSPSFCFGVRLPLALLIMHLPIGTVRIGSRDGNAAHFPPQHVTQPATFPPRRPAKSVGTCPSLAGSPTWDIRLQSCGAATERPN